MVIKIGRHRACLDAESRALLPAPCFLLPASCFLLRAASTLGSPRAHACGSQDWKAMHTLRAMVLARALGATRVGTLALASVPA